MKNKLLLIPATLMLLVIWGCPNSIRKHPWNYDATFPDNPVNLLDVNSIYDDYNSALPEYHFGKKLIFSSNRITSGESFDLVGENFHVMWDMEEGKLTVDNSTFWMNTNYVARMLHEITWEGDQYGPYAIGFDTLIDNVPKRINVLAYSTNNGSYTFHEEYVYHVSEDEGETGEVRGPFAIESLWNPGLQQYISFYGPTVASVDSWSLNPNKFTEMYVNKREKLEDIFRIKIPDSLNFLQFLESSFEYPMEEISILNSDKNDLCAYVNGNMMVFASDRDGGYGGYDLYYSYYDGNAWQEPQNFGDLINTEYDEFRPVTIQIDGFLNDVMLFSSNRPGGMGGFDLYYVGIEKINPSLVID